MTTASLCLRARTQDKTPERSTADQDPAGPCTGVRLLGTILGAALLSATACAPMPRSGPETAPPARQAERTVTEEAYTTYFAFDSDRLDDDARAVVAEAVAAAKAANLNKVVISGHSDSAGTADYNRRLSEARVTTVAAEFVDSGLPLSKIELRVFGEERPLVITPDGQSAAMNRRAEIRLVKTIATATPADSDAASDAAAGCDLAYIWSGGRAAPVCVEKRKQTLPQAN